MPRSNPSTQTYGSTSADINFQDFDLSTNPKNFKLTQVVSRKERIPFKIEPSALTTPRLQITLPPPFPRKKPQTSSKWSHSLLQHQHYQEKLSLHSLNTHKQFGCTAVRTNNFKHFTKSETNWLITTKKRSKRRNSKRKTTSSHGTIPALTESIP